jgi:hypothetical protein
MQIILLDELMAHFLTGQFSFQGLNLVYGWSCQEYVSAIWASIELGGGEWFSWEGAKYLTGLVDYAFSSLTATLRRFSVLGTRCKECS